MLAFQSRKQHQKNCLKLRKHVFFTIKTLPYANKTSPNRFCDTSSRHSTFISLEIGGQEPRKANEISLDEVVFQSCARRQLLPRNSIDGCLH